MALSNADAPAPRMPTRLPTSRAKSISSLVCAYSSRGSASRMNAGTTRAPLPSAPEASTTVRASTVSTRPAMRTDSRKRSGGSGSMSITSASLRTSSCMTSRYQPRYACQSGREMRKSFSQPAAPCCASYHARKVRLAAPRSGPVRCFGVRSISMRANVIHGPSRPRGLRSNTATRSTCSRFSPAAMARPNCPPPTMAQFSASAASARVDGSTHGFSG